MIPRQTAGARPYLALNGRRLAATLFAVALACAVVQVALGASLPVLLLSLVSIAAGLLGLAALGPYTVGGWVSLFYALGNTLVALYAKTLLGQTVDSHLRDPVSAYFVAATGSLALLGALVIARSLRLGRPILVAESKPVFLSRLGWFTFVLGLGFSVANRLINDGEEVGFGGLAVFRDLLFMAVIARTAMVLEKTGNKRSLDAIGVLFILGGIFAGLIENQKTQAALPAVAYFATVLFYRRGINRAPLALLAVGAVVFSALLAPTVHALRALGQQSMPLEERVSFVVDTATRLLENPQQLAMLEQLAAGQFQNSYYNYFGDDGTSQMLLGRFAYVQAVDPVVAEADRRGTMGGDALWPALRRLLPGFIVGEKSEYREEFLTVLHYGLISPNAGKFPTLPLVGQAYAAYGVPGVLIVPFVVFLLFAIAVRKVAWSLDRNIFGIFFFVQFVVVYAAQGSFVQYVGMAVRNLPIFVVLFLVLGYAARIRAGGGERPRQNLPFALR